MTHSKPVASKKPSLRRQSRIAAVQFLFHLDLHGEIEAAPDAEFWQLRAESHDPEDPHLPPQEIFPMKARKFSEELVHGVLSKKSDLDALISKYAQNYELNRIAAVDRNILRLAIYELFFNLEVPPVVAINEAIDIAKAFGSEESGKFINGILDRIRISEAIAPRPPGRKPASPPKN